MRLLAGGQFSIGSVEFDFDNVRARVRERHLDAHLAVDLRLDDFVRPALAAHLQRDVGRPLAGLAGFAHGDLDGARLADEAELGRLDDLDAPVELVRGTGQQRVHGRIEAERCGVLGNVMHLSVGDHDHAGDAIGRRVVQGCVQIGEQVRASSRRRRSPRPPAPT